MANDDLRNLGLKALRVTSVVLCLSLHIFTHERELVPLYSSVPTARLLKKIVFTAVIASAAQPIRVSLKRNLLYTALALTLAPNATYWIAVWTARWRNPLLGPAVTQATTLAPLVFLLTTFVVEMDDTEARETTARSPLINRLLRGSVTYLIAFQIYLRVWSRSSFLYSSSDNRLWLSLAGLFYTLWIASLSISTPKVPRGESVKSSAKKAKPTTRRSFVDIQNKAAMIVAFNAFWWTVYNKFGNPILPHPLPYTYHHPTYPLQILSAEQSVTGLITVGQVPPLSQELQENNEDLHSARYLRASHSILGGVWTHDKVQVLDNEPPITDSFGTPLGDSIYSAFVIQEAARLVDSTEAGKSGKWQNALIIGLGAGISATAFQRHGITTTIVEIDPAVYTAARTYFGLPDPGPGRVFLEDARGWAYRRRAEVNKGQNSTLYDIVIHDCFSGGGVPEHIFTLQFWSDLKTVMQPDAVLVVNFAGVIKSSPSLLIVNTLLRRFGQCRAFHDLFEELPEEKYSTEFVNMVIFCTNSSEPLTFRRSTKPDWLGSPLRRHALQSMESREVNLTSLHDKSGDNRYILTDQRNPLGQLQEKQVNHHWSVMRQVLPDTHWETF